MQPVTRDNSIAIPSWPDDWTRARPLPGNLPGIWTPTARVHPRSPRAVPVCLEGVWHWRESLAPLATVDQETSLGRLRKFARRHGARLYYGHSRTSPPVSVDVVEHPPRWWVSLQTHGQLGWCVVYPYAYRRPQPLVSSWHGEDHEAARAQALEHGLDPWQAVVRLTRADSARAWLFPGGMIRVGGKELPIPGES